MAFITGSDKGKKIILGDNVQINDYAHISSAQRIANSDNVLIINQVYAPDNSHGSYKGDENDTDPGFPPAKKTILLSPVEIGKNVWIGECVIIMPGVKIGDGAIIGAHSVVNKNITHNCIAAETPSKLIKI